MSRQLVKQQLTGISFRISCRLADGTLIIQLKKFAPPTSFAGGANFCFGNNP
jgi:hypothetical protein